MTTCQIWVNTFLTRLNFYPIRNIFTSFACQSYMFFAIETIKQYQSDHYRNIHVCVALPRSAIYSLWCKCVCWQFDKHHHTYTLCTHLCDIEMTYFMNHYCDKTCVVAISCCWQMSISPISDCYVRFYPIYLNMSVKINLRVHIGL